MIAGFESGYPGREERTWCLRREGATRTLCGRKVRVSRAAGFFPGGDLQPTDVKQQCPSCAALMRSLADSGGLGVCPVCGEPAAVVNGLVAPHDGCSGAGSAPRGER